MKHIGIKQLIISHLIAAGYDFNKSPFELSTTQSLELAKLAKGVNYRKPKNSYFSTGRAFFAHLQKIFHADRLLQEDLKQI